MNRFLLTHPVWDVTLMAGIRFWQLDISTHTSRVGCDEFKVKGKTKSDKISTHTSRVGCDDGRDPFPPIPNDFYSHIPCGM